MPITVTYGNGTAASSAGLKAYFADYNTTFGQNSHGSGYQGFSSVNTSHVTYDGRTYGSSAADLQYAVRSTNGTTSTAYAFIAEAKALANGGTIGQLVYSNTVAPTHTLFGDLDVLKLGSGINLDPSISPAASTSYSLGTTQVTFSNLTSVLNEGLSGGHVIAWNSTTETNDVHEIIYPLIGGGTGDYTRGLEDYLDSAGILYQGSSGNERFDAFDGNDEFRVGGGTDTIYFFESGGDDVINLGGLYGYASGASALTAAVQSGGNVVLSGGGHQVTLVGVDKGDLVAADFVV